MKKIWKKLQNSVCFAMVLGSTLAIIPSGIVQHFLNTPPLPWSQCFKLPAEIGLMAVFAFGFIGWLMDRANHNGRRNGA